MNAAIAADVLGALALESRIAVFRLLVRAGPGGVRAGDIADAVGAHASTLSANLAVLSRAGLIAGRREGRAIYYRAEYGRMRELIDFLLEDCCNGAPEVCAPRAADACCEPAL